MLPKQDLFRKCLPAYCHHPLNAMVVSTWSSGHHSKGSTVLQTTSLMEDEIESLFINALVRAGTCRRHGSTTASQCRWAPRSQHSRKELYRQLCISLAQTRQLHSQSRSGSQQPVVSNETTRDHYLNMLDYYRESSYCTEEPAQAPQALKYLGPDSSEDLKMSGGPIDVPNSSTEKEAVERLIEAVDNQNCLGDELFEYYSALPSPGVSFIPHASRCALLSRFSAKEEKFGKASLRYLSLVDDMKLARLPLNEVEWNKAIHLAGRCVTRITAQEVENALRIWKEMEEEASVQSSTTTFSILFDIATKAGQFPLAEMILKEMDRRGLQINRFTRVGLIYYHGLKADGDKIRQDYRAFVEAGEIVDTTVLNCVIASLLRAGEPSAAEQVYERMKRICANQSEEALPKGRVLPPKNRKESNRLAQVLAKLTERYKGRPGLLKELQDDQSLTPNTQTFVVFIEHHVSETGELYHIAQLLDDMQILQVPVHGRLFMELFRGFAYHGGIRYTSWTRARLGDVWQAYLKLHDEGIKDVYMGKWMVIWVIRAFAKCSGRKTTLEIWEELKSRWKAENEEMGVALVVLKTELGEEDHDL